MKMMVNLNNDDLAKLDEIAGAVLQLIDKGIRSMAREVAQRVDANDQQYQVIAMNLLTLAMWQIQMSTETFAKNNPEENKQMLKYLKKEGIAPKSSYSKGAH